MKARAIFEGDDVVSISLPIRSKKSVETGPFTSPEYPENDCLVELPEGVKGVGFPVYWVPSVDIFKGADPDTLCDQSRSELPVIFAGDEVILLLSLALYSNQKGRDLLTGILSSYETLVKFDAAKAEVVSLLPDGNLEAALDIPIPEDHYLDPSNYSVVLPDYYTAKESYLSKVEAGAPINFILTLDQSSKTTLDTYPGGIIKVSAKMPGEPVNIHVLSTAQGPVSVTYSLKIPPKGYVYGSSRLVGG